MGHSSAAYARDDIEDARRGAPAVSLEGWASARGLEWMGSTLPGAFSTVMPRWSQHVFNLCRGSLSPHRHGFVDHELDEISLGDNGRPTTPGGYHGVRVNAKIGGLRGFARSMLHLDSGHPDDPFGARAFWVPITKAGVRVPEAALLPLTVIRSAERFPLVGHPALDDLGLPGLRMRGSEWIDDQLRAALAHAAAPLAELQAPWVALRLDRGVVSVARNGFVTDEARLDHLVGVAARVADGLAAVTAPLHAPQPFGLPLPGPDLSTWPPGYDRVEPHEADVLNRVAAELGMALEDAVAFHRAHPRCPAPGRAIGVVRGPLPGSATEGRVAFFVQGGATSGSYRSVVMVPATAGASTPVGGLLDAESDLYVEVTDGVAHCWPRARSWGALRAADTVAASLGALRRLRLAEV